ncbi:jg10205 [Pararge aegeria aegeria]|uniref:Jg10205 protein n=2 Tax=Pararge aegeria TaxID=116150 RepID=A0A8S4SN13_9NEOP|nr:jg10205 [Pararge aegeria aegeria]
MFDLNGDGDVDCEEFEKVAALIRQQSSIGSRHRDHANTGNTFKGINSALTTYFFGQKLDEKLTIEKFLDFQQQLQKEILSLEFQRKQPDENGRITEADFAELLLAYAGYPAKKKARMLKRVKKAFRDHGVGITKDDYLKFFHLLNNVNDVDTALTFYHIAGASIDQPTLRHVAKTVAHVDLDPHVINVVFTIFDENMDGQLSNREFVAVMKNRLLRGLEKPKDTGFVKLMYSLIKCARDTKPAILDF